MISTALQSSFLATKCISTSYMTQHICGAEWFYIDFLLQMYTERKKETPINFNGEYSLIVKTTQRNCLVWVKSAICRESSFGKQKFIVAFCTVLRTIKYSNVNNFCDKPCASFTTRHLRCMDGLRRVILACGMSPHTSWITRHNCTMVSRSGSRDLIWQSGPSPMLDRVHNSEYVGQGSVWTAFDPRKSCVRQIENEKALYREPMKPSSTPLPIQDGASTLPLGTQC